MEQMHGDAMPMGVQRADVGTGVRVHVCGVLHCCGRAVLRGRNPISLRHAPTHTRVHTHAYITTAPEQKLLDFLDGKGELQLDAPEALLGTAAKAAPSGTAASASETAAAADGSDPAAKRPRLDAAAAGVRQERQLRNRNTMLIAPNKDFQKVLAIVEKAVIALRSKSSAPAPSPSSSRAAPPKPSMQQPALPIKPSGRFDREVAKDQLREMGGEAGSNLASGIDMYGAYAKGGAGADKPSGGGDKAQAKAKAPAAAPQPKAKAQAVAGVKRPAPSSSAKQPSSKPVGVRTLHACGMRARGSGEVRSRWVGWRARTHVHACRCQHPHHRHIIMMHTRACTHTQAPSKPKGGSIPIIIVPAGLSAMINMFNAQSFLESGKYETAAEASARMGGQKPSLVLVSRTAGKAGPGDAVPYHVVDKPPEKGSPDWARVVAVITQGVKWQFKVGVDGFMVFASLR
jgi:parafibromin